MGRFKVRYLVAKRQKRHSIYYWQPNKRLRGEGFLPCRLAERTNSLSDAIQEAEVLNVELDAWRAGELDDPSPKENTIPWLTRHYQRSEKYDALAPKTQKGYDECMKVIEAWSARAGHPPISTITPLSVEEFYKSMGSTPFKANAVIRVLRLLLNRALKFRFIDYNPAAKPEMKTLPPRHQVWDDAAISAITEAAVMQGRRSIALAIMLGAHLGQRQGDVLRLGWAQYDGEVISLRQRKTKRPISVPVVEQLKHWLDVTPHASTQMVVSEETNRPYKEDNFRHVFAEIRNGLGFAGLQYRDLRRTAAVRLAEAGCTAPEIASITGHRIETTQRILDTYVPRTSAMARNAIIKLERNKKSSQLEG